MIIGLTGYAQSGKDSIAEVLVKEYGFKRFAFADKIKELAIEIDPILFTMRQDVPPWRLSNCVKDKGWERAKVEEPEVRRVLQRLGVGARGVFGQDFWVDIVLQAIDIKDRIVITDVRFQNEAEEAKRWSKFAGEKAEIWRVTRPGVQAVNSHISELDMANYTADVEIHNGGTLEDLRTTVMQSMVELLHVN